MVPLWLYVAWFIVSSFFRDYLDLLLNRKTPAPPPDWSALERGDISHASHAEIEQGKVHLSKSCEVHGECIPRTSHYGLIAKPLRREE